VVDRQSATRFDCHEVILSLRLFYKDVNVNDQYVRDPTSTYRPIKFTSS